MSGRQSLMENVREWTMGIRRRQSWPRPWVYAALCLVAVILAAVVLIPLSVVALNGYVKGRVERAFDQANPGATLRIRGLVYAIGPNRLAARSITLRTAGATMTVGRVSLAGVRWMQLLRGRAGGAAARARTSLDVADLTVEFPGAHYGIRCARVRVSQPDSELVAQGIELAPLAGDEEAISAGPYRTTWFRVSVPELRVRGLACGELLNGTAYRARSVHVLRPAFDAFAYHEKPPGPFVSSPLMVNEALAAIRRPLRVDSLSITDGYAAYRDRVVAGAAPGVLTFTEVNALAVGITNRGAPPDSILLRAQGKLMDAGLLKLAMVIPPISPEFSLRYSGSLGPMDLTRLGGFLDIVEYYRIKSGRAQWASYEIDVKAGRARGQVRASFDELKIAVLDRQTGTEKGWDNRIASFLANRFTIRPDNTPAEPGPMRVGTVRYRRKPGDTFLQVVWFALRSGVLDVIHR